MPRLSYKAERRLMEIAASTKSFDEVVKLSGLQPRTVRSGAVRLGLRLGPQKASDTQLIAALHRAKAGRE